jgi:hypothetical protein
LATWEVVSSAQPITFDQYLSIFFLLFLLFTILVGFHVNNRIRQQNYKNMKETLNICGNHTYLTKIEQKWFGGVILGLN